MHIEYRISEKDYRAAAMLAMRKRSTSSSLDYYGPYIFGVVWIAAAVIPSPLNNYLKDQIDSLMTFGVVPIVIGFLAMRRKGIKRDYAKLKNVQLLQVLDLDSTGLRLVTTAGVTRSAWKIYSKFAEDPKTFILFLQGTHDFLPIPKGELTLAQIDELRALLVARLPADD
jgi:hypothetical protein